MKTPVYTLWQPWAGLVIFGGKDIENRHYPPPSKFIGERIAIHAAKTFDQWFNPPVAPTREHAIKVYRDIYLNDSSIREMLNVRGAILGTVKLEGYLNPREGFRVGDLDEIRDAMGMDRYTVNPWWDSEQYGWILSDPKPLKKPIPAKGKQGVWYYDLPEDEE